MGIAEDLAQLERQLRELRIQYERYFAGLEKTEPAKLREQVARTIRQYSGTNLTNTGQSFRLNALTATFNAYNAYWSRVVRQIEEGTYARDRFRLKLKEREQQAAQAGLLNGDGGRAGGPAAAAGEAAGRSTAPAAVRFREGVEPEGQALQGLYEAYVAAKRKAGEPVEGLRPEKLAAVIKQQLPQIAKRFNCESVEFRVVVEGGKAKLKAVPK